MKITFQPVTGRGDFNTQRRYVSTYPSKFFIYKRRRKKLWQKKYARNAGHQLI